MMISENLDKVIANINAACAKCGRDSKNVTLIAVSKTKPCEDIMQAYNYGIRVFGENRVQELMEKKQVLPEDIQWHLIGHLQTNKVHTVLSNTVLIHSVDTIHLAETINAEAVKKNIVADCLIEINVAGEESKFGFGFDISEDELKKLSALSNIRFKGLMTVAPYVDDPEENRPIFRKLRALSVDIRQKNYDNISMEILSMGMTGDYCVAIEEGATHVRVGTGIFGNRERLETK